MLSGSEFIPSIGDISFFEAFSKRRSFAFAQDDDNEMCGVGKVERAERSGLPRFFFGYFLLIMQKKVTIKF
jgi:hypothetical protein